METALYYIAGICLLAIIFILFKNKIMFLTKFIFRGLLGLVSLFLLNILGQTIGVTISLSFFSVATSVLLGLPGIAALLFINVIT